MADFDDFETFTDFQAPNVFFFFFPSFQKKKKKKKTKTKNHYLLSKNFLIFE